MKNKNQFYPKLFAIALILSVFGMNCSRQTPMPIPSLKEQGTAKQLIVDGKPFVALCWRTWE